MNGQYCYVAWCEVDHPHKIHEGHARAWHGRDIVNPTRSRTLSTVLFGTDEITQLGMRVVDTSTTAGPSRMAVWLPIGSWLQVADVIAETTTKLRK